MSRRCYNILLEFHWHSKCSMLEMMFSDKTGKSKRPCIVHLFFSSIQAATHLLVSRAKLRVHAKERRSIGTCESPWVIDNKKWTAYWSCRFSDEIAASYQINKTRKNVSGFYAAIHWFKRLTVIRFFFEVNISCFLPAILCLSGRQLQAPCSQSPSDCLIDQWTTTFNDWLQEIWPHSPRGSAPVKVCCTIGKTLVFGDVFQAGSEKATL